MAHLKFLLLLLWVGESTTHVVDLRKRIYGGHDCQNERHYHVKVFHKRDKTKVLCGSLIHPRWKNIWKTNIFNRKLDIMLLELSEPLGFIDDQPPHLQCANMHVVDCELCLKEPYVDTRGGDSGGGVIYNNMIYGVFSGSGVRACTVPAVTVNVCPYMKWINQTIYPKSSKPAT
uniref:Peptidase S1 domain-containing protein n=1 Tax=Maylandia zebra TaxID=106582 RepID=A0A3P9DD03_9CICH